METPPGKVIRSLRQALDMTQAEFARAAGWSTSTISSWERGSTQPSRLAFKTILAFAEERGVRYQPKAEGSGGAPSDTLPVVRLGSRLSTPVALDAGRPSSPTGPAPGPRTETAHALLRGDESREESYGSRRWTEVAASRPAVIEARRPSLDERPEWHVEATLKVKLGTGSDRLRRTGVVAASLLALVVGVGAGVWLRTGVGPSAAPPALHEPVAAVASVPQPPPPVRAEDLALAAAPVAGPPLAQGQPAELAIAPAPIPAPPLARLESIVALGGTRRATFRVGDRSIALVEGDAIGARAVGEILNDEVMLVGSGASRRVRLGSEIPLE